MTMAEFGFYRHVNIETNVITIVKSMKQECSIIFPLFSRSKAVFNQTPSIILMIDLLKANMGFRIYSTSPK